ncbi:hypothetical protein ACFY78_22085 [Streptomyces olindensis]
MAVQSYRRARQEETGVLVRPYVARLGEGVYAGAQAGPSGVGR